MPFTIAALGCVGKPISWLASLQLQIAHDVVGEVHQRDHGLGPSQSYGADEFAAHGVMLKAKDMLDPGADGGAQAVEALLCALSGLPRWPL